MLKEECVYQDALLGNCGCGERSEPILVFRWVYIGKGGEKFLLEMLTLTVGNPDWVGMGRWRCHIALRQLAPC
ncbi:hypothetical protein TIFTF001_021556 [Ficus carica]|uniref:Uncharacterized protein n=1 Tax=Ficus carica TaxID=3494 RepID=A0AA88AYW8_FICCA|nr:hypothetical protein TIFTF001_021556 [Ficus carica]